MALRKDFKFKHKHKHEHSSERIENEISQFCYNILINQKNYNYIYLEMLKVESRMSMERRGNLE